METHLTIKHLAPYLPYGLEVEHERHIAVIVSLYLPAGHPNNHDLWIVSMEDKNDRELSCGVNFKEIKPILRPLSDLTKEIEVNGEKFVPLLEICKFLKFDFISYEIKSDCIDLVFNDKLKTKGRFWFSNFKGSGFYCSKMNKLIYKDIIGAIEKLFEWHFDVFGLIEKELAVDINTLNK